MAKVQSDFLWKWLGTRANAAEDVTGAITLATKTELVNIDASGGSYPITLMPVADPFDASAAVATTRILMINGDANLSTNNITLVANGAGVTIEGQSSFVLTNDNQQLVLRLQGSTWIIQVNSDPLTVMGAMFMIGNTIPTVISNIGEYVDIEGTILAGAGNELFDFDGDDTLTYTGVKPITIAPNVSLYTKRASAAASRVMKAAILLNDVVVQEAEFTMSASISDAVFFGSLDIIIGDEIKMQIQNTQDTANVIVTTYNFRILEA